MSVCKQTKANPQTTNMDQNIIYLVAAVVVALAAWVGARSLRKYQRRRRRRAHRGERLNILP
jgi:purine-cytosine permease-like protein